MIWEPSREFIEQTNVWRFMERLGFGELGPFLRYSREEPERFWDELMREMRVEWFEPYRQVVDAGRGPEWTQWFPEGRLNIAHNCLDRWAGDPARIACICESENGETRIVTFADLRNEANRVANGLRALGLESGDRVALCLPMVPEILSILYGSFKAGLTVVPIFAGFGAGAIATRLEDSGARVLFTAGHLERRGKILPLREKMPQNVEHTIVLLRAGETARDRGPRPAQAMAGDAPPGDGAAKPTQARMPVPQGTTQARMPVAGDWPFAGQSDLRAVSGEAGTRVRFRWTFSPKCSTLLVDSPGSREPLTRRAEHWRKPFRFAGACSRPAKWIWCARSLPISRTSAKPS